MGTLAGVHRIQIASEVAYLVVPGVQLNCRSGMYIKEGGFSPLLIVRIKVIKQELFSNGLYNFTRVAMAIS